jgi:hypothetical protein
MKLWLDDQWNDGELPKRNPPIGWTGVATVEEAQMLISIGIRIPSDKRKCLLKRH